MTREQIEEIVELACAGNSPSAICRMLPHLNRHSVKTVIIRERHAGTPIPYFSPNGRDIVSERHRNPKPEDEVVEPVLSDSERERLTDLASRNIGIQAIARLLGNKPYALVVAEIESAGLSRVRGGE